QRLLRRPDRPGVGGPRPAAPPGGGRRARRADVVLQDAGARRGGRQAEGQLRGVRPLRAVRRGRRCQPMSKTVDAPAAAAGAPLRRPRAREAGPAWKALMALASLRLTVVLFALAFVLVFLGTLAQVDEGIFTVLHKYFRTGIAWIPLQALHRFGEVFFG